MVVILLFETLPNCLVYHENYKYSNLIYEIRESTKKKIFVVFITKIKIYDDMT